METQMILNHKAALELLVNEADLIDFTSYTIFSLHDRQETAFPVGRC